MKQKKINWWKVREGEKSLNESIMCVDVCVRAYEWNVIRN